VGLWVAYETELLSRAAPAARADVSSLYAVTLATGFVVGPLVARVLLPATSYATVLFVSAAASVLNAALLLLRVKPIPTPPDDPHAPTSNDAVTEAAPPAAAMQGSIAW
jgi:hypothetical protein